MTFRIFRRPIDDDRIEGLVRIKGLVLWRSVDDSNRADLLPIHSVCVIFRRPVNDNGLVDGLESLGEARVVIIRSQRELGLG